MTDDVEYTVSSRQPNSSGALAEIEGACASNEVVFLATLHNADDPKVPLGFATSSLGGIIGKKRINDDVAFALNFPRGKWANQIILSRLSNRNDEAESADTTWRVLAEIETSKGSLVLKVPMFDPNIQKLIARCKEHHEVEKKDRRLGKGELLNQHPGTFAPKRHGRQGSDADLTVTAHLGC